MMLAIFIPGRPIAFARAASNGVQRYTPEPQASYAAAIGTMARAAMSRAGYQLFVGPVEVIYRATYAYPARWPAAKRDRTRWRTSAPDADNLAKLALDALSGIVFADDAPVARLVAEKVYGEPEGATLTVQALEAA